MRNHELGLDGNHLVLGQHLFRAGSQHRGLVHLDAHAVTDETRLLGVTHEVVVQPRLAGHLDRLVVEVGRSHAGLAHLAQLAVYLDRAAVCIECFLRQFAYRIDPGHIGHVTGEVAAHVDHHRHARTHEGTVGTHRYRAAHAGSAHGKIVRCRSVGIVAAKHVAHEYLHALPVDAEEPQVAVQTQQTLDFDLEFDVGHAVAINRLDAVVHLGMLHGRLAQPGQFILGLHGPRPTHHSRRVRHLGLGEYGSQTYIIAM